MDRRATSARTDSAWPHRIRNALLLSACAEALARPFAGRPLPEPVLVDAVLRDPDPRVDQPGCGSVQTMVMAQHLAEHRGDLDEGKLAAALARGCGPHRAAGQTSAMHEVLADIGRGVPWQDSVSSWQDNQGSGGNEAAVRATPIGLLPHAGIAAIAMLARRSATVTHAHRLAQDGAAVYAVAVALAAHGQPAPAIDARQFLTSLAAQSRTPEFRAALGIVGMLARHRAGPAEIAATVGHDSSALRSIPAAVAAYLRHPEDPPAAIRRAILIGGDTTAIAAMTGALAGARNPTYVVPGGWPGHPDTIDVQTVITALTGIGPG